MKKCPTLYVSIYDEEPPDHIKCEYCGWVGQEGQVVWRLAYLSYEGDVGELPCCPKCERDL